MVGADTSRTSANGSSGAGKRERDSSPILDSDDDDDDFAVSKPKPQGTLMINELIKIILYTIDL